MSKATFFFLVVFLSATVTNLTSQCLTCEDNTVDLAKYASAIGKDNFATGYYSTAIGRYHQATGNASMAIGFQNYSKGEYSIAIGRHLQTDQDATNAVIIGRGYSSTDLFTNSISNSLMVGFLSEFPTFMVTGSIAKDKTGRVGIGNTGFPLAKLHIYSDEDENATLFLQPSVWDEGYNAEIWLGNQNHGVIANSTEGMVYNTEANHIFKGGDVYIEDIDKGIIMKSPDGRCWRGTLTNDGILNFVELETCPEILTELPEPILIQADKKIKVYPNPAKEFLTVEIENPSQDQLKISLVDERGVIMKTANTSGNASKFYTGDIKAGIYFVKVVGKGQQFTCKVIVE